MAYRHIMIQCINDQCNVFAHITGNVIWFCKKFLRLIYHIGSEKLVKHASSMCFIEFLKVVCKQTESGAKVNSAGTPVLKKRSNLQDSVTRRDHVINQDHILACYIWTKELIGCNRMSSSYILGVVKAFVIHAHINTQDVCKIDRTAHAALIRADDHKMLIVNMKSLLMVQKSLDKLIRRLNCLKSMKWSGILNLGVMCIESDNIFNSHIYQFMKGSSTVKRLSSNTLALTTLIKVWHDYIHAAGLSSNSCNYTLQILIMIIRRHQVGVFANWI